MTVAMSKATLLEQIEREQAIWEQFLAEIGEERMLQPGATGDWSFKDVVAHLSGWREQTLAKLDAAVRGGTPTPRWPAHLDESDDEDLEQINDWMYQTNRGRSLQEVLGEYHHSFVRMRDAVAVLSEHDLTEPTRYPWMNGQPLGMIVTSSFEHFHEEHEPTLRQWLGQA